ncbi:MAG: DUF86 domain-containing protein [Burkholderiales bacterium]|nr:DUF86 domain-containing protein [Burkholderiales bacterium]
MPPDPRDAAHLWDMLTAAHEAHGVVQGISLEAFMADRLRLRALERTLELLGEAARRVSLPARASYPEIPWRALIGQRNLLAHEYGRINPALLYQAASDNVPSLIMALEQIIESTN